MIHYPKGFKIRTWCRNTENEMKRAKGVSDLVVEGIAKELEDSWFNPHWMLGWP